MPRRPTGWSSSYPHWWTDLLSGLDSRTQIGFRADDPDIAHGVTWFIDNQEANGLRNTGRNRLKNRPSDLWVGLAVCRMLNAVWAMKSRRRFASGTIWLSRSGRPAAPEGFQPSLCVTICRLREAAYHVRGPAESVHGN